MLSGHSTARTWVHSLTIEGVLFRKSVQETQAAYRMMKQMISLSF